MISRVRSGPGRERLWMLLAIAAIAWMAMGTTTMAGVPNDVCADCHSDISEMFHNTAHGIFFSGDSPQKENSCESCHGSGLAHANDGDPELIINPANSDQFGGQLLCLTCHDNHKFDEWAFSGHKSAGVTCADCHNVHSSATEQKNPSSEDLCYKCHSDVKASAFMPSHHPIAEGIMTCQSCHNPHGSNISSAFGNDTRELCFSCHAEKEGPFVFEHAPVNEDCMICHTPHGSVVDNLLKQAEPNLCLNCHAAHFHTGGIAETQDDYVVGLSPTERTLDSDPSGFKSGMLTKCTQCHEPIHGTDLPSQEMSNGANALTR